MRHPANFDDWENWGLYSIVKAQVSDASKKGYKGGNLRHPGHFFVSIATAQPLL
jgi:hypothetical protein